MALSAASNEQAEALLDTANSASQHVAVLHVAFMALCTYVLVIVGSTTDMNLLIGKGVMLPVVDVKVPIVGFYAVAPYLVMLVHFNLLLQLLLLSRQLYAFDAAVPQEKRIGGLRDRLHIFLYAYYLVGRLSPFVRWLLGFVTGITLLVLPLATLLMLQLRFLAYQHQAITWMQRVAVWFSVALVIALWPVIMNPGPHDSWHDYLRQRWIMGLGGVALWLGFVLLGFVTTKEVYFKALWTILVLLIFFAAVGALARLWRWWRRRRHEPEDGVSVSTREFRGMPGLLLVVALGVPLPLGLLADGEWWEEELLAGDVLASKVYRPYRHLDLSEQVLLTKAAKPELVAKFRKGDPEKVKEALKQVQGVTLRGRSLRGALFFQALLPGADLREAQLQGANLRGAKLQGADLREAQLVGADLREAQLQGANLPGAQLVGAQLVGAELQGVVLLGAKLQGADLREAQLVGAQLVGAELQGADLSVAQLQGANLLGAKLVGAQLIGAELQGADLSEAQLQAANLLGAKLQGANLQFANIYGAFFGASSTALVDLRFTYWMPLRAAELSEVLSLRVFHKRTDQDGFVESAKRVSFNKAIERAAKPGLDPPIFGSCLIASQRPLQFNCQQKWMHTDVEAFRSALHPVLEELACESSWTAGGLIRQVDPWQPLPGDLGRLPHRLQHHTWYAHAHRAKWVNCGRRQWAGVSVKTDARIGLAGRFAALLDKQECVGLSSLSDADKDQIRDLAKREEEECRGRSGAGKRSGEVSASPTPPPAIAPATP